MGLGSSRGQTGTSSEASEGRASPLPYGSALPPQKKERTTSHHIMSLHVTSHHTIWHHRLAVAFYSTHILTLGRGCLGF